jgi:hypothetical protein
MLPLSKALLINNSMLESAHMLPNLSSRFLYVKSKYIYIFAVLGLELRAYTLSHFTSTFSVRYFQNRVL